MCTLQPCLVEAEGGRLALGRFRDGSRAVDRKQGQTFRMQSPWEAWVPFRLLSSFFLLPFAQLQGSMLRSSLSSCTCSSEGCALGLPHLRCPTSWGRSSSQKMPSRL